MLTVDHLLEQCGGLGRFQWFMMTALSIDLPGLPWSVFFMSFGGMTPDWYCLTSSINQSDYANGTNFKTCHVNGTRCEKYRFEGNARTVVTEWDLVCDKGWIKAMSTSAQMFGTLFGALIIGQIVDIFGRKKTFYSSLLLLTLSNFFTAFVTSWELFLAGRFLIGLAIGGQYVTRSSYAMEFTPIKWRPLLATLPIWNLFMIAFSGVTYALADWRHLHILNGVTMVPAVLTWFWVPESARWLAVQGRIDEAVNVFKKVASTNGRKLPAESREVFENVASESRRHSEKNKKYTYLDLVNNWYFGKITAVMAFTMFSDSLIHYGVTIGISGMAGNAYINLIILQLIQVPAGPPAAVMTNWLGRRWTVFSLFLLSSLTSSSALMVHIFVESEIKGAIITALILTTYCLVVTMAFVAHSTWKTELYPTVMRGLGSGLLETIGLTGGVIAPFIIDLEGDVIMPFSVIASLTLAVALLSLTLPETKGQVLPDIDPTRRFSVQILQDAMEAKLPGTLEDVDCELELGTFVETGGGGVGESG